MLAVIGRIGTAGGTGYAIEFAGSAIRALSMEGRMTVCNMAIEAGARAGMVAVDDTTIEYLHGRPFAPTGAHVGPRGRVLAHAARATTARSSTRVVALDAAQIEPQVTWGTSPEMVVPIDGRVPDPDKRDATPARRDGMERALHLHGARRRTRRSTDIRIDKVFIGSCTNSRIEDLRAAAAVARGRRVASNVKLAMVVPGSGLVKAQAEREGLDRVFRDAGFEWREPGCSMCLAMNDDRLEPGERCASTSNRNFEGRQGAGGRTHLVSPAMAAAAAIAGHFVDVRRLSDADEQPWNRSASHTGLVAPLDRANVDTDAIIPKQFLKSIKRTGFGPNLFDAWRYLDHGEPGMDNAQAPAQSGFRAEPAALPGRADPARARELRLRQLARARAVGARRLRLPRA